MAVVTLKLDEQEKALYVKAADAEEVSLSEWIRRACDQRLGRIQPVGVQVGTRPFRGPDPKPSSKKR